MRPEELMAAAILADLLDARAEVNDGPKLGPGRFDWLLVGRTRTYALEVTSHNEQHRRSFDAQTETQGGIYRAMPDLPGVYLVRVETTARPATLWNRVPSLIRDHFPDGVGYQELASIRWNPDDPRQTYAQMLTDLGVLWITGQRGAANPGMQITAEMGWSEHPSVVADAVAIELDRNRTKLAIAADADERHLFVWIDPSAIAAHYSLRNAEGLPVGSLELGDGIDVVWVAGMDLTRRPAVVGRLWRVESNQAWQDWTDRVRSA
jgi:hypothetical protein